MEPSETINTHGGKRAVQSNNKGGRPTADKPLGADNKRFIKARADKEEQLARLRSIEVQQKAADLKERIGDLVRRDDVERQFSVYVTTVVMFLDTLPDILERDAGIDGEAVARTQVVVDKLRADLHSKLEKQFS